MAEFQANEFTTTLVSSITAGDVTLTLASTVGTGINGAPSAPFRVRIEDEIILVGTRVGTLCSVLSRGEEATTAAFHAAGSEVRQVLTVAGLTDAIVSYAAPLTATFVTSTDQTSTLTNSRQVLAGTNITLDTSIAGDLTINATSSASSPGGLNTYVQFNDASTFGGDAGFLYAKGTDHAALGPGATLGTNYTLRVDEDFAPAGLLSEVKSLVYARSDYQPTASGVGIIPALYGYYSDLITAGAFNIAQITGLYLNSQHGGSGTLARSKGVLSAPTNTSTGTVTSMNAFEANMTNTNAGGTVTDGIAFYATMNNSGTWTRGYGVYLGGIAGTTGYGVYSEEAGAGFHYVWLNSDGVLAIDEASNNQAILSLYNPGITKYTSGSANYERSTLRWTSNVLEFGSQAGGTGTLRGMRLLGQRIELPAIDLVNGANDVSLDIAGAGILSIATTDANLYIGAAGTFAGDGCGYQATNLSNAANSYAYLEVTQGNTAEAKDLYIELLDATDYASFTLSGAATHFLFNNPLTMGASVYLEGTEMTAPSAPAANGFRLYAEDTGGGKTRLMCLFNTGAAQQVALQP